MTRIKKINFLLDKLENKLENSLRAGNLLQTQELFKTLKLEKKHPNFETLFQYTAMNLAGIGLKNDNFGEIQEGKYVQIISISHTLDDFGKKITKNSSLGYYGKAESISEEEKKNIIEFILRWRYEKSFQHSDYYQQLLEKLH